MKVPGTSSKQVPAKVMMAELFFFIVFCPARQWLISGQCDSPKALPLSWSGCDAVLWQRLIVKLTLENYGIAQQAGLGACSPRVQALLFALPQMLSLPVWWLMALLYLILRLMIPINHELNLKVVGQCSQVENQFVKRYWETRLLMSGWIEVKSDFQKISCHSYDLRVAQRADGKIQRMKERNWKMPKCGCTQLVSLFFFLLF